MSVNEILKQAKGGSLVAVPADKGTYAAVRKAEKMGLVEFCGRDHDGAGNRWIMVQATETWRKATNYKGVK